MTTETEDKKDIKKKEETETVALHDNEPLSKAEFIKICHRIFDQNVDQRRSRFSLSQQDTNQKPGQP